jgi:cobalt-zinc-cadmium efflux system protein
MFTHCFAILIGIAAIRIARNPPCHHRTFGLYRAEILSAMINGMVLLVVVGFIIREAVRRMIHPELILGMHVVIIALTGLSVNLTSIFLLRGQTGGINVRSIFFHMMADATSSIGVLMSGLLVWFYDLVFIDPIISLGISAVILWWAIRTLIDSGRILLEIAPKGINTDVVMDSLKKEFPQIRDVSHAHLWSITQEICVFTAHLSLNETGATSQKSTLELVSDINRFLKERYGIIESTLQVS